MDPDTVEHGTATGERNVPPTSAPDAVSPLSEAPEKTENIDLAGRTGGSLKSVSRPNNRPNARAYRAGVYAALARYKPTAVQRGSTTVTFEIGATGALNDVHVGKSSGNSQIDQLALQMVRDTAPFPPPPNGASSYTIQIDFQ
jgi:protein TonB